MRSIQERFALLRSKEDLRPLEGVKGLLKSFLRPLSPKQSTEDEVDGPLTRSLSEGLADMDEALRQVAFDPEETDEINLEAPRIARVLVDGVPLLRITRKKKVQRIFKVDLDKAVVTWSNKTMALDSIQQIRKGEDAKNYREEYGVSKDHNDRWATILYNEAPGKLKALHIIAPAKEDLDLFVTTLERLVTRRRQLMKYLAAPDENFAHIHWNNYIAKDPNKRQFLSFDDVVKLTRRLHINCDELQLQNLFEESDTTRKGALNFEEFQKFVKQLKQRPEVVAIFKQITQDNTISLQQFENFITAIQFETDDSGAADKIYSRFSQDTTGGMTLDGFTDYLASSALSASKDDLEDLSHPLNEYFIASSHNTYLLGRQYGHSTSIEGYIRALQRGCRSVEIDIWDGDQGPVVTHGKITSSIPLSDVLETIKKYAFMVTPFPLFLSLEVHCRKEYQYKVRLQILKILDDMLITDRTSPISNSLPSPMELKHKILIKVKKTSFEHADESHSSFTSSSVTSSSTAQEEEEEDRTKSLEAQKRKKSFQIVPELSSLGIYAQGMKFINFSLPEAKQTNHIFSFSERTFENLIHNPEKNYLIQKHNRKFLMRVYPAGYRYKSSNFLPIQAWAYGTQMVATNWQTFDLGQQVNEAMFNYGSKSGYRLKPPELRNTVPTQKLKDVKLIESYVKVSVDIISAQLIPRPKDLKPEDSLDPYVAFEFIEPSHMRPMRVTELDTQRVTYVDMGIITTKPITSNGFNPLWNCRVEATIKNNHGLNFIRFTVKTGDISIAVQCLKLDSIKQGYRHIPLFDLQGEEYIFSTLFVKVNYELFTN